MTNFARDHRKSSTLFTCTSRLYRRVQSENIRLEGDAVYHVDNIGNVMRTMSNFLHGTDNLCYCGPSILGQVCRAMYHQGSLSSVVSILRHGGG